MFTWGGTRSARDRRKYPSPRTGDRREYLSRHHHVRRSRFPQRGDQL